MRSRPRRAYLDSNVFIYGILEACNSRLVLFLAQLGEFEVVVSQLVLEEVERFFRANFSREAGYLARRFVESIATRIVRRDELIREMRKLVRGIREKDVENVASVRMERIAHLVAYDADYAHAKVREYLTPKKFVQLFGVRSYEMEY